MLVRSSCSTSCDADVTEDESAMQANCSTSFKPRPVLPQNPVPGTDQNIEALPLNWHIIRCDVATASDHIAMPEEDVRQTVHTSVSWLSSLA